MHSRRFPPLSATAWPQYELLDFGHEQRLERWGDKVIVRPDVEAFGRPGLSASDWGQYNFRFEERRGKPGRWVDGAGQELSEQSWPLTLELKHQYNLELRLTPYKHLGVFPEQFSQWQWLESVLSTASRLRAEPPRVLNLFAYTGVATLVAARSGAHVTHIEASKSTISWGRRNQEISGMNESLIRWIPEDAVTFVEREIKRGNRYDAILLDPPAYGIGPGGKRWQMDRGIEPLLRMCADLLTDEPLFVLLNAYASSLSPRTWSLKMADIFAGHGGEVSLESIGLESEARNHPLPTGLSVLWSKGLED